MLLRASVFHPAGTVAKMKASYTAAPTPGWVLNENWKSEEGLPRTSILIVKYYSGDGCRIHGLTPMRILRNALLAVVLVDPTCIVSERADNETGAPVVKICRTGADVDESADVVTRVRTLPEVNALLTKTGITFSYTNDDSGAIVWHEV